MNFGHPLRIAIDSVWEHFGDRSSLLGELPADAVLARSRSDERRAAAPRILELLTSPQPLNALDVRTGRELMAEIVLLLDEPELTADERSALMAVLDRWWAQTLMFDAIDDGLTASQTLALLAMIDAPLVRWLEPWLTDLDGAPARHLVALVQHGLDGEEWHDQPDLAGQVRGWTRSEPVIMGITLVGGVHLDEGDLSAILDELLSPSSEHPGPATQ